LNRFIGRIFRLDPVSGKAEETHVGMDSAFIDAGGTAQIRLVLRRFTGSADICIEVEGWASDSSCLPPPPPPIDTSLAGCYVLNVLKTGTTPGHDTLTTASLHISQYDSTMKATVRWNSGQVDSASGYLNANGTFFFGYGGPSNFQFTGAQSAIGDTLVGWFNDSLRHIMGSARANLTSCLPETTIVEPEPIKVCFNFTQSKANGKTDTGRVGIEDNGAWANVYTHWNGFGSAYSYDSKRIGSLDSSGFVEWHLHPPAGMFPDNLHIDSAAYSLTIQGTHGDGKIVKFLPQPKKELGSLLANRVACRDSDFRF